MSASTLLTILWTVWGIVLLLWIIDDPISDLPELFFNADRRLEQGAILFLIFVILVFCSIGAML